jgi:pilus assembly protein Flp/PilA
MFLYLAYHLSAIPSRMRQRSQDGASAVEYGLLVALIAAIIVGAVFILGDTVNTAFEETNDGIENPGAVDPPA